MSCSHVVQDVAVKTLYRTEKRVQDDFVREVALMKFLSRDRNIVQFYGACVHHKQLWLVLEFMEVCAVWSSAALAIVKHVCTTSSPCYQWRFSGVKMPL